VFDTGRVDLAEQLEQESKLQSAEETSLRPVLTVSQLTAQIRVLIEDVFSDIYVVGEVSNAKLYPSGHWYFSLKDKDATLPCILFKSSTQNLKFRIEDGLMLVARGKLSVYPPRGAYQMVVNSLEPVGIGEWQLAFEQLKKQLDSEGLLDSARKRALPMLPKRIGVVTSTAGAALRDILSALARRNRNVHVVIAAAKVQGEGSAEEVADAILALQKIPDVEVIIVARGGGSIEDLWSFNTEIVARAVATCSVPVSSGVGHETDITICDLVADLRAPTPTAAAELVARGSVELIEKWTFFSSRLNSAVDARLALCRRALERANPLSSLTRYQQRLQHHRLEVVHREHQMVTAISRSVGNARHHWRTQTQKLITLGPMAVLKRGFAVLRNKEGQVIRTASEVKVGEELEALLEKGRLRINVQSIEDNWY
jgi:exodeoxyribonuclease VII large subunit